MTVDKKTYESLDNLESLKQNIFFSINKLSMSKKDSFLWSEGKCFLM